MLYASSGCLSEKETAIINLIFYYRGLRGKDIATLLYKTYNYSLSNEKSIYNYLTKLKRKGLIKSFRLQEAQSLGSLYYLTKEGLELIKNILNLSLGQNGNGLLPANDKTTFWDIPFDYQMPPLKQVAHFLATIDFYKELVADQEQPFIHKTTHYSNLYYYTEQRKGKIKPDATVYVNERLYAVEIDRATESHEQLLQKFIQYKDYIEYCAKANNDGELPTIDTILFVVEARVRRHGIQRRWTNVLSAFLKAFGNDFPDVNLILVPLNEVAKTMQFEVKRSKIEEDMYIALKDVYAQKGYEPIFKVGKYPIAVNKEEMTYKVMMLQLHLEFEARLYKDKYEVYEFVRNCSDALKDVEKLKGYQFFNGSGFWWSPFSNPKFAEGIETTKLSPELLQKMKVAPKYFEFYQSNQFNS